MGWHPIKNRQTPRWVGPRSADRTGAGKRKQDARAMVTEFVPYSSGAPWGQKASRPRSRLLDAKNDVRGRNDTERRKGKQIR
jgi:hypothetical protein